MSGAADAAAWADTFAQAIRAQEAQVRKMYPGYGSDLIEGSVRQALADAVNPIGLVHNNPPVKRDAIREIWYIALDAAVRRVWQMNRIVYDVDETLWEALGSTEPDTVIPKGLFERLPHPDPFIAIPHPIVLPLKDDQQLRVSGFFVSGRASLAGDPGEAQVSTHSPRRTGNIGLLICGAVETLDGKPSWAWPGVQDMIFNRVTLRDTGNRDVAVQEMIDEITTKFDAYQGVGGVGANSTNTIPALVTACVSALVYVCSVNAELRPLPASAARRKAAKAGQAKPPKVIQVGYQTGAALRAHRRSEAERVDGLPGKSVRPHIRRAHFHTYRVGAGRTDSIVKWLSPIPINITGPADKSTVVKIT